MSWTRREFLRRSAVTGALLVGGGALLTACGDDDTVGSPLERARETGRIKIGIAGEVPYGFTDDSGNVTGQAPEVAKAVFRNLGIEQVEAEQVAFGQLIPALNAGQFDVVAAGMAILPERCQNAAFSAVDYLTLTALLVPAGNPEKVKNFADIADRNLALAVLSGSIEQSVARDNGVKKLQSYDDQAGILQAVRSERAYCGSLTDISLRTLVKQNPRANLEVTDGFVLEVDGEEKLQAGGFVFRPGDDALREAFNAELRALQASGEWLRIAEPFGFSEDNVPPAEVTTEKLCAAA